MATLLNAVSSDGAGAGASHSGPCTIWVSGDFDDGAEVVIQGADADTAAKYSKLDDSLLSTHRFKSKGSVTCTAYGTYFLRAVVKGAGPSTSITVITTQ